MSTTSDSGKHTRLSLKPPFLFIYEHNASYPTLPSRTHRLPTLKLLPPPPWCKPSPHVCPLICKKGQFPFISKATFLSHLTTHASCVKVYTDGSKSTPDVACAALTPTSTFAAKLLSWSSIFTDELYAILLGLKCYVFHSPDTFMILSDSQSILLVISPFMPSHPIVLEIQDWLTRISAKRKCVTFAHILIQLF